MKKVAVVLSGCGVYDGAEIHESVITLLALDRADVPYQCLAPDIPQMHVINHLTGEVAEGESRNVLVEAARIARGDIQNLASVKATDFSAVIFPGGFGAAKNLCDFAVKGADCSVNPDVEKFVLEAFENKIPMGFVCIAPALMSKIAQKADIHPSLTIGTDADTANALESMGSTHISCPVKEIAIDEKNRIISTPAYMLAGRISEAAAGIENLVNTIVNWIR